MDKKQRYRLISGAYAVKLGVLRLERAFDKSIMCYDEYQNSVKSGEYEIMVTNCVLPDDTCGMRNDTVIINVLTHDILFVKEDHLAPISCIQSDIKYCACCGRKL